MKYLLIAEEFAMLAISVISLQYTATQFSWWAWTLLFFSPDLGMLGYLVNTRAGAFTYNLLHHKAVAALIMIAGWFTHNDLVLTLGIVFFAHSSFDRIFGYGLKYSDNFKHTHLGWMK